MSLDTVSGCTNMVSKAPFSTCQEDDRTHLCSEAPGQSPVKGPSLLHESPIGPRTQCSKLAFKVFNESSQNHRMKVCAYHNMFEGLFRTLMHWYICFFLLYTAFQFPCPRSTGHKCPSSHDLCWPSTSALPVVRFPTQAPWKYSHCSLDKCQRFPVCTGSVSWKMVWDVLGLSYKSFTAGLVIYKPDAKRFYQVLVVLESIQTIWTSATVGPSYFHYKQSSSVTGSGMTGVRLQPLSLVSDLPHIFLDTPEALFRGVPKRKWNWNEEATSLGRIWPEYGRIW